jgi:SNF2 family DNA or RNA helicase
VTTMIKITSNLWPHQQAAFDFAATRHGAMLAMEMGTGKTLTALALIARHKAKRTLIVCPKSVIPVWASEIAKHTEGLHCLPLGDGTVASRAEKLKQQYDTPTKHLAVVVNYDIITLSAMKNALKRSWDYIIWDECHKLKTPAGKQSLFASQLMHRADRRLGLTGTPMPHSPLDIYAQFRAIQKGIYPRTNAQFKALYADMHKLFPSQVVSFRNLDDLWQKMDTVTFRCRAADVLTLPPATDTIRYCELSDAEATAYEELTAGLRTDIKEGTVTAANALVRLLRLQQITSGFLVPEDTIEMTDLGPVARKSPPADIGHTKRSLLRETLADIAPLVYGDEREPVVVFCRFKRDLQAVHEACEAEGLTCSELSGEVDERADWVAGKTAVLAVQLQAGGLGIDLTRARYCIYYSNSFNMGDYLQTRARVHRPGQTRPVTYIHLLATGTIDTIMLRALQRREDVVESVLKNIGGTGS